MVSNTKLIESAYEAFGRADIQAIVDLSDDGVVWTSPRTLPQGGQYKGKAGVGEFFQGVGAAWSDLTANVESLNEAGADQVITVVRLDGTLRSGGPAGYGATHVFTLRDGKIVQFREFTDLDAPIG